MLLPISVYSQKDSGIISNGKVTSIVQSNGNLFVRKDGKALNHLEDFNSADFLRYSSSWMVGVDGQTIFANKNCKWETPQLWPGPIDTVTNLPKNAVEWSKVWTITREDVDFHKKNYLVQGYKGSDFIKNWPAKHDDNNISPYMAPYIDWNSNGVYDPENGDYPSFEGDYACYFIANDLFGENIFPQANKIGVEIQGLVYAYDRSDLANTLFIKLYLINRSDNDYSPFYFGQYLDYQLGNDNDNVVATDVNRSMVYGYNGDKEDENAFGSNIPSAGCVFLNHPLYASTSFNPTDSLRGLPMSEAEMLSVMNGSWRDNSAKYAVGQGISGTSTQITKYIYPKMTDALVSDLNWSDETSTDPIGMRKMLGVVKFDNFNSKSFKRIDLAFVFAQDEENTEAKLQKQADNSMNFFRSTLSVPTVYTHQVLDAYPNPLVLGGGNAFYINALSVQLIDETGQLISELDLVDIYEKKFQIPCSEKLASGVYYLKAVTSYGLTYKKVILISK